MEGVTHPVFREIVAEKGGVGLLCTEFVRVSRAPLAPTTLQSAVVKVPGVPLSVQVMGNEAEKMAEAARLVEQAGADVVDINLGCPMPRVVKKGVGAAMLKDPDLLEAVVGQMRAAVRGTLSAKIRAGFDDAANVVHIARLLERVGVDFLAVHPRRRCDFYEGVADWRIIATLREALDIPVVGNGDVWYATDALRMQEETGCAAVMIGRPAMRNPWIFDQAAALREGRAPIEVTGPMVADHLQDVAARYLPLLGKRTSGKLKELVRWIGRALDDDGAFKHAALRAPDVEGILELAQGLRSFGPERLDLQARPTHALERSGSALSDDGHTLRAVG